MKRSLTLAGICSMLLATSLGAQRPTFRSTANGVVVDAFVNDGNKPVLGLSTRDFSVLDNGVSQAIDVISARDVPLDVTLVVESDATVLNHSGRIKDALRQFKDDLRPVDRLQVLTSAGDVQEVLPMTPASTAPRLDALVNINRYQYGSTVTEALIDAMIRSGEPERRHIIIALATVTRDWIFSSDALVPVARVTDAVLYFVALPGMGAYFPDHFFAHGQAVAATGGELLLGTVPQGARGSADSFHFVRGAGQPQFGGATVVPFDDAIQALRQVMSDFRRSYIVTFSPSEAERSGWHDIVVRIVGPDATKYTIRARKGYFGG